MFVPYTGGAGPSQEQVEMNTRHLAEVAGAELVTADPSGIGVVELWAKKGDRYAIYDRWGYCSADVAGTLDQGSLEEAIAYLQHGN